MIETFSGVSLAMSTSSEDLTPQIPQGSSLSRSTNTYIHLTDREVRPSRSGIESQTMSRTGSILSPCQGKRSRIPRQRLENLPPLSLIVLQACKRMREESDTEMDEDVRKEAYAVSKALQEHKYDTISFLIARRRALTALVSEGVMSLELLALILERMANICRLQPLGMDISGIPSAEKAALMVDRWLRRTAEIMLDGTIEVATTMEANKKCRSRARRNSRGHSSKQRTGCTKVVGAEEGLPITARVHYNDDVDMVHFDVDREAEKENEAPTPARFLHFGESPKHLESGTLLTPTSVFEQTPVQTTGSAPTPSRWNHFGGEIVPAAQAA